MAFKPKRNKMIGNKDFKGSPDLHTKKKESFFFPEQQITIEADSLEEAVKKLNKIKKNK